MEDIHADGDSALGKFTLAGDSLPWWHWDHDGANNGEARWNTEMDEGKKVTVIACVGTYQKFDTLKLCGSPMYGVS
ncbi:hypothetical protein ACF05L_01155 [Streptomyces bobili]|uniref:hypothetical protein n=1 Tax=Streptomyces bobili TaxID=67280 RepID=UPI0036FB47AF